MSEYMRFVVESIKKQEKDNEQIVINYWEQVSQNNDIHTKYESLQKKMLNYSEEESISPQILASYLLKLEDIAKRQVLKLWVIKAERQNLNEIWKKKYIESKTSMKLIPLPKSGKNSLYLNENFKITSKSSKKNQSEKSKGIKTFDFILIGANYPNTSGYTGILVVDKTVKVTGGSQMDVQKEIDSTINHLCSDPKKRKFLILLDGEFFYKYVQENKNQCENIFFTTTDELIENNCDKNLDAEK